MTEFKLPDLGEGLPDAEIVKWVVKVGDQVNEGDDMVEMSTAKAVVEVPCPHTGVVTKLHGEIGDVIKTGHVLISFDGAEADTSTEAAPVVEEKVEDGSEKTQVAAQSGESEQFLLPDLGEGLPDAEIVKWDVAVGDTIIAGETMVDMSTAKAVVEVPSPFSGTVLKLFGQVGDVIKTGDPLIEVATGNAVTAGNAIAAKSAVVVKEDKPSDAATVVGAVVVGDQVVKLSDMKKPQAAVAKKTIEAPVVEPTKASDVKMGPAVRSLVKGLGIDPSTISATGPRGTLSKDDVFNFVKSSSVQKSVVASHYSSKGVLAAPKVRARAGERGVDLARVLPTGHAGNVTLDDVNNAVMADFSAAPPAGVYNRPVRESEPSGQPEKQVGPRRVMAQMMAKASSEVCKTSLFDDVDISAWPKGTDITVRILRSIIAASMVEPAINAWYDQEAGTKTVHKHINLGVAVDSPKGLFVPVLHDAQNMSDADLRGTLNARRESINNGTIKVADMSKATITLSNFGMLAGRFATPIVVPPEVAIIGIGGLFERVIMDKNSVSNHRHMPVSITFDHRAATGGEAARFLGAILADLKLAY